MLARLAALSICLSLSACGRVYPEPYPVTPERMAADIARQFHEVYPARGDPDERRDAGLLSPRFGLPAIVRRGAPFAIDVLERGGPVALRAALVRFDLPAASVARCLGPDAVPVEDCFPLRLDDQRHITVDGGLVIRTLRAAPAEAPPARAYDLVLVSSVDPPQRVRRAVFLTDADPTAPRPIRVVQLSDLHLGKSREIQANLEAVIRDVNAISPDLVIVTGDLADQGRTMALEQQAADVLLRVDAPILVILGNHDYGHFPTLRRPDETDQGFYHFARAFHPFRWTHLSFAGWDFIGFDSGPSLFSPRILTRGVLPETLDRIQGAIDDADRDRRRGVVLFSHAPTRAVVGSDPDHTDGDGVGSMFYGAKGLEDILLLADRRRERVIHLSGHTHWSDVFEPGQADFDRWPWNQLTCPRALRGGVAMISAPSATHITFPTLDHGRRSGFVEILLDDRDTRVVFHLRDRAGNPVRCEGN